MSTKRLPQTGSDSGQWGTILNSFLTQLSPSDKGGINYWTNSTKPTGLTIDDEGRTGVNTQNNTVERWNGAAWDVLLSATSNSPVSSVAGKTGVVTLDRNDVGLGNVDNTSDSDKPISSATQTGLDGKQNTLVSGTNIKTVNSQSLLGGGDISITSAAAWGSVTGTLSNQTDLQNALNLKAGKNYTFLVGSTAECDYKTTDYSGDLGATVNAAIAALHDLAFNARGGVIQIKEGDHTLSTSIDLSNKSNVWIKGASAGTTKIISTGQGFVCNNTIEINGTVTRYKNRLSDFYLAGNGTGAAIEYNYLSDASIERIIINNFAIGIKGRGLSFYNNFLDVKIEDTAVGFDSDETGLNEFPTAHKFVNCKFLNGITGALLKKANQIQFIGTEIENFDVHLDFVGCFGCNFSAGRLENTSGTSATCILARFGSASANNMLDEPYIAANVWSGKAAHFQDSGLGNIMHCEANYKEQFTTVNRGKGVASDWVKYESVIPGGTTTQFEVSNTYTPSGTPTIYKATIGRALGKLYSGNLSGTENFSVLGNGLGYFAGGINVNNQKIINLATPAASTDAANKAYVDANLGAGAAGFGISPANMGFLTFNYQPFPVISSTDSFVNGNAIVVKIPYTTIATITNAHIQVRVAGATLTNCFAALYRDRVEIGKSSDQSTAWTTTGLKTIPLTASSAGSLTNVPLNSTKMLELVFWVGSATTRPQFARGDSTNFVNGLTSGADLIFSFVGSPASIAYTGSTSPTTTEMGTRTTHNISYWVGLS